MPENEAPQKSPDPRYYEPRTQLKARDLVTAWQHGSERLHIISLRHRPYPNDSKKRAAVWDGHPLCDAAARYYWTPEAEKDNDQRCRRCFQRWRAMGSPALANPPPTPPPSPESTLPWGWREVAPVGITKDMEPPDGTVKRREIRRWVRGDRYVRICEAVFDKETPDERKTTHYLHVGWLDKPGSDRWKVGRSALAPTIAVARTYMLLGGNGQYA